MLAERAGLDSPTAPVPGWLPEALRGIDNVVASAPTPISDRVSRAMAWLTRRYGGSPIEEALTSAVATPFLGLLDGLRADYGIAGEDPAVVKLGEATLALYLYVRIQDDIVDEPAVMERAFVYVAELFNGASQRAFAQALPGTTLESFLAFRETTMATFANAATWELDMYRSDAVEVDQYRMGQKFLPMAVCLGAMALLAGRADHLDPLVEFVTVLGTGLQVVNDVLNVKEDHAGERLTPVLAWLYDGGKVQPGDPANVVRAGLLTDPALPRALAVADQAMSGAERRAQALGAERVASIVAARRADLADVPHRLFKLFLNVPSR